MRMPKLYASIFSFAVIVKTSNADFNFEIGNRAHDRLTELMGMPTKIQHLISTYRTNKAFPHDFEAPDRDLFLAFGDALLKTFPHDFIYYGLEDGTFVGHQVDPRRAMYREPGQSGYDLKNDAEAIGEMQKHFNSCIDKEGNQVSCLFRGDEKYIQCQGNCDILQKCQDEYSQRNCSQLFDRDAKEMSECESKIKWCKAYEIKSTIERKDRKMGFIPRTTYCIDSLGKPSQTPGNNSDVGMDGLGNCYNLDGVTPVNRHLSGDYAFCGGDGIFCNSTFVGGYESVNYDPRFRPWYIRTKEKQMPNWIEPYIFFHPHEQMGITYSHPIYTTNGDGRNVFAGVVALDFTLEGIASFLMKNYGGSDSIVVVLEKAEPNFIIASSDGSIGVERVLIDDNSVTCPEEDHDEAHIHCTAIRIPVTQLNQSSKDLVIMRSYEAQKKHNFPESELLVSRVDELDMIYASQTKTFSIEGGIEWRILIICPVESKNDDTIMPGDKDFAFLVTPSVVGFVVCSILLFLFICNRNQKEIIVSDWKYTGAFILGCVLLNLACLSMVGPNTDELCLARMWIMNFFGVFTLAPLFVKIYRLSSGVEPDVSKRQTESSFRLTLFLISLELIILVIFTFVDPNKMEETSGYDGSNVSHRDICSHDTMASFFVQAFYQGGLIFVGTILVVWIISAAADLYQGPMRVFITIAIFWMSVFSTSVFVLPRLLQIRARKYSNILNHESESRTSERSSKVPGNTSSLNNVELNGHRANAILRKHSSCTSVLSAYCIQTPLEPIPDERAITRWASSDN
ncbi:hypothetical protein ACHAXS_012718 [Conticribra weissflogii]